MSIFKDAVDKARYNRSFASGPIEPSKVAISNLLERVERMNGDSSVDIFSFIDAQSELVDALLVALDVQQRSNSSNGDHDA